MLSRARDSPSRRFCERTLTVSHYPRKLARSKFPLPDTFDEGRVLPEFAAVKLMRIDDSNWQPNILGDNAHRLRKIGVVGDKNRVLLSSWEHGLLQLNCTKNDTTEVWERGVGRS